MSFTQITMNLKITVVLAVCRITNPQMAQEQHVNCVTRDGKLGFEDLETGYLLPCWEGKRNLCNLIFLSRKRRDFCNRTCCNTTMTTHFPQSTNYSTPRPSSTKEIKPDFPGGSFVLSNLEIAGIVLAVFLVILAVCMIGYICCSRNCWKNRNIPVQEEHQYDFGSRGNSSCVGEIIV